MQIVRTSIWIAATAILVAFMAMNWDQAPVNLWPLEGGNYIHFQWPVGIIALIFFLLGFAPMWLIHRAAQWRLHRRIAGLETSLRLTAATPAPPPAASSEEASVEADNLKETKSGGNDAP